MKYLIVTLLMLLGSKSFSQNFQKETIRKHITFLASDELEGRGTGSIGEMRAANYIAAAFLSYGLQPAGTGTSFFQTFATQIQVETIKHSVTGRNVIGFLDNGAKQTLVIGAHYDHLGKGFQGSSLSPDSQNKIHNGADDNASGTAGCLALAEHLAKNNKKENFNYLFIAFSGEELGLIGSKFYTNHPTFPLEEVSAMINMDMIGRLDKTKGVIVSGYGTSPVWGEILPQTFEKHQLKITTDSSGTGASDHTSFYLKDIPVLQFFTGGHGDYHKTTDDIDKINFEGEVQILEVIAEVIDKLDRSNQKPAFTLTTNPHQNQTTSSFKVTLGVMPDYSYTGIGLKIDGVTKGRPADRAGIISGDIILHLADTPIKDIYDYMEILGKHEKGQKVTATILRNGKQQVLNLIF